MPRSGWIASWPPCPRAPIAHGLPGSSGPAVSALLRALAVLDADRVDRRQVEDVEAQLGERGDLLAHAPQAAPRAREQLVPGAEAGADALDVDLERALAARVAPRAVGVALDGRGELGGERGVEPRGGPSVASARRSMRLRSSPLARAAASRSSTAPSRQLARQVLLAGGDLALDLVAPGREAVGPRLDRPRPAPAAVDREAPAQRVAAAVVVDRVQRRLAPAAVAAGRGSARRRAGRRGRRGRCPRATVDVVADARLGRVAPAVDQRGGRSAIADPARAVGCVFGRRARCAVLLTVCPPFPIVVT